jgi:hypothetical protein
MTGPAVSSAVDISDAMMEMLEQSFESPLGWQIRDVPPYFDGSVAREWLHNCQEYHSEYGCNSPRKISFETTLIDCTTREIHQHDGSQTYAALSYVWGGVAQPPIQDGKVPLNASTVVNDAIKVTQKIGLRYLWVDQYCVEQSDHNIKKLQLSSMDLVYSQAEITIVAACGLDANHGLPGVDRPRIERPKFNRYVDYDRPQYILGNVVDTICSEKWSTRGWTFQEARLSRRLLCFTDTQCYWECRSLTCVEQLSPHSRLWEFIDSWTDIITNHLPFGPRTQGMGLCKPGSITHLMHIYELLAEYSQRVISFDEDAVYAILGVLRSVDTQMFAINEPSYRTSAILGLPLVLGKADRFPTQEQSLACTLSWYHLDDAYPVRRHEFPSWTWAGWKGQIRFGHYEWGDAALAFYIEDVYFTNGANRHRVALEDVQYTTEATMLHFQAPELSQHWVLFDPISVSEDTLTRLLLDRRSILRMSEETDHSLLLEGLHTGLYKLALMAYNEEKGNEEEGNEKSLMIRGYIWVLRRDGSSHVRSGIIDFHLETRDDPTPAHIQEAQDLADSVRTLIRAAPSVHWEIT